MKIELAPHVGVNLPAMLADADTVRGGRPVLAISARGGVGVDAVMDALERDVLFG